MTQLTEAGPPTSRNIPAAMKRDIRQRCGFGCVICGHPIYDYDHMLGWANVHRHAADEITLLCDAHHRQKGAGLLPDADVKTANASPFNVERGISSPFGLRFSGAAPTIWIGSNNFRARNPGHPVVAVMIDDVPVVAFLITPAGDLVRTA